MISSTNVPSKTPKVSGVRSRRRLLNGYKKWDGKVEDYNFDFRKGDIYLKYFAGGKLNVSYNCLDRHLATRGDKVAIQWEGNEPRRRQGLYL